MICFRWVWLSANCPIISRSAIMLIRWPAVETGQTSDQTSYSSLSIQTHQCGRSPAHWLRRNAHVTWPRPPPSLPWLTASRDASLPMLAAMAVDHRYRRHHFAVTNNARRIVFNMKNVGPIHCRLQINNRHNHNHIVRQRNNSRASLWEQSGSS